ncbi:MAG: hypothetical protein AAF141_05980 [Pseudomonadota bacterium]
MTAIAGTELNVVGDQVTLPPTPSISVCDAISPITWSVSDTDETVFQIKEHNEVVATLCGGDELKERSDVSES